MARAYYTYGGNLLNREKYTSVVETTYGKRRYFSSIDTDVYFGNYHIDEMVAFDFILEEKKMPIFGYNNFTPKRVIIGQKTIQGSFAINFTQSFSLKTIIDSLKESLYASEYEEPEFYCADDNKALFGKGFDITLSYGEAWGEGSYNACTQTLVGCYITSYRQAFDTSGEPILDMYTFIAKDLLINTDPAATAPAEDTDKKSDNDTTKDPISTEQYVIGNNSIEEEANKVYSEVKEKKAAFGIFVDPIYQMVDGIPRISTFISSIPNDIDFKIKSITIDIMDNALSKSYTCTLNKFSNEFTWYYEMKGTDMKVGKEIDKLFNDGVVDSLDCTMTIVCSTNTADSDHNITYSTILSTQKI